MMMTGTADARRSVRRTSSPSMSGNPKSNRTRSQPLTRWSASAPRLTSTTVAPVWPRSSASADATPSSSSTSSTRMVLMLRSLPRNLHGVDEFGVARLDLADFARLPFQVRASRGLAHEDVHQQRDQRAAGHVEEEQRDEVDPRHLLLGQAGRVDHEFLHVRGERVEGDGAAEGQAHDGQALARIAEQDPQAAAFGVLGALLDCEFEALRLVHRAP